MVVVTWVDLSCGGKGVDDQAAAEEYINGITRRPVAEGTLPPRGPAWS